MSKMKHLLRKLHIGGGINDHQRLPQTQSVVDTKLNHDASVSTSSLSPVSSDPMGRFEAVDTPSDRTVGDAGGGCVDFDFLEEEFQLQMAMAISASDPGTREDPESAQIDAAKRMSLGCSSSVSDSQALIGLLSLQYWSYNAVNYDEKVMDGFYDIYGITTNSITQGKMPLLVDLQAISVSREVDYEVILVNRLIDTELQELESRADAVSMDCRVSDHGLILSGLIQKIADIVVDRMGGHVNDADEMLRRWTTRSYELRRSLKTIILPIGRLDIGLSRHRALLFKVLADKINLPCMLVKGSYYTGTDDGAVNLIKLDNGSEYIIDLMGAPGTLIPSEVPSTQLPNYGFDLRRFSDVTETSKYKFLALGEGTQTVGISTDLGVATKADSSMSKKVSFAGIQAEEVGSYVFEESEGGRLDDESGRRPGSQKLPCGNTSGPHVKASCAQKKKVKSVSQYVISAAKNPEFAQKLHAVLLESGASPPPDLFVDIDSQNIGGRELPGQVLQVNGRSIADELPYNRYDQSATHEPSTGGVDSWYTIYESQQKHSAEGFAEQQRELETISRNLHISSVSSMTSEGFVFVGGRASDMIPVDTTGVSDAVGCLSGMIASALDDHTGKPLLTSEATSCQRQLDDKNESVFNRTDLGEESSVELMEMTNTGLQITGGCRSEKIFPELGEVAEWEIPWDDLHIGERIGIGSYGEVYRADWNGTEVAVKKFLDQDFSGDALVQLKCEVEIMLRLRHPNVVLFMGAVTRPPHFSILTEFLPRESLYRLLHRPNSQLDEKKRLRMALDVVKGMNYLHTSHPTIVHRDLKSPNLLVDKNWVVKVCDFGLSRIKNNTFLSSKSTAGTPEWMAPEVLRNEPANEKCDVYSFGVILWELATCQIPWKGLNPMQVVGAVGFQNRRLEIPNNVDPAVSQIICDCWQMEAHLRPSFSQLMSQLRHLEHLVIDRPDSSTRRTG